MEKKLSLYFVEMSDTEEYLSFSESEDIQDVSEDSASEEIVSSSLVEPYQDEFCSKQESSKCTKHNDDDFEGMKSFLCLHTNLIHACFTFSSEGK